MLTSPRLFVRLVMFVCLCGSASAAEESAPAIDAEGALAQLQEGNTRFVSQNVSSGKPNASRRAATAQAQHPVAIIVGCADSRTSPEIIFDQNIGDLFVIRTAGNLVDDYALGSIEYAVEHLGARLVVVLGHARCGAIAAAVASDKAPGHIGNIVRDIFPAVQAAHDDEGDILVNATRKNVDLVAAKISRDMTLKGLVNQVRVIEG